MSIAFGKVIFGAAIGVATFIGKSWRALLNLQLTQKQKELELVGQAMEIRQKDRMQSLMAGEKVCDLCKKLRLSAEKTREAVEPYIQEAKDPLSIVARRVRQGTITLIDAEEKRNTELPGGQGQ